MEEYKNQVEAVLFAAGKKLTVSDIARLCRTKNIEIIEQALRDLKQDYEQKNSSLMVVNEGEFWKITVRERYQATVQKITADTELTKSVMETLAVVAYKAPCLQSDIIKIRTNKAYDHLNELESTGYIKRVKSGRTKRIMLTQHFYDYFDLTQEKLTSTFGTHDKIEELIKAKEAEAVVRGESKKSDPEVDLVDEEGHSKKLEVYESKEPVTEDAAPKAEITPEKIGDLELVEELPPHHKKKGSVVQERMEQERKEEPRVTEQVSEQEVTEEPPEAVTEEAPAQEPLEHIDVPEDLTAPPPVSELEKEVDVRAEEMLHPPKDSEEESSILQMAKEKSKDEDLFEEETPRKKSKNDDGASDLDEDSK